MSGRGAAFDVARSEGVRYLLADPGTTDFPSCDEPVWQTCVEPIRALQEAPADPLGG